MNEFKEALKEGARVLVLAIIPLLIDSLNKGEIDWTFILITGTIAVLRFIDSWLHKTGIAEKGITRF